MNKSKNNVKRFVSLFLALALICTLWGVAGADAQAATPNKYGTYKGSKPSKYSFTGSTIHVLPKKVFYVKKTGKLYYSAYVYNNTGKTIYGLKDMKITVSSSSDKVIASKTFFQDKKKSIVINSGSYKVVNFVFEKKYIKNKKFNFKKAKKLKTQTKFTYYT